MEFRINKIDTDLRNEINQERSEDKIHNKKGININKDKNKEENNNKANKYTLNKARNNKEQVDTMDKEDKYNDPNRGRFVDIRR